MGKNNKKGAAMQNKTITKKGGAKKKKPSNPRAGMISGAQGPLNVIAPGAVALKIPKTFIDSYHVPGGMGFRGIESLGHLISKAKTGSLGGGTIDLVKELSVNPLNPVLFPRTCSLAQVFEQYSFKKLRFFYVPRSSSAVSSSILHYFDYDPADPAATNDLELLANDTRDTAVVWQPSSVDVDIREVHRNRNSFFVQSSGSLDAASLRQDYCGVWRCYTQSNDTAATNYGYLFVEYDLQLHVPRPSVPALLVAQPKFAGPDGSGTITLATNSNKQIALPYKQQQIGMIGGPNEGGAAATTFFDDPWGSLQGVYDAAKQIYSAGKWITGFVANAAAAAFDDDDRKSQNFHIVSHELKVDDRWSTLEESLVTFQPNWSEGSMSAPEVLQCIQKRRGIRAPNATGDLLISIAVWDLNGNPVPGDWPATANPAAAGLVSVPLGATKTYTGTGAQSVDLVWEVEVPTGKQYLFRNAIVTAAESGSARVISDLTISRALQPPTAPLG